LRFPTNSDILFPSDIVNEESGREMVQLD